MMNTITILAYETIRPPARVRFPGRHGICPATKRIFHRVNRAVSTLRRGSDLNLGKHKGRRRGRPAAEEEQSDDQETAATAIAASQYSQGDNEDAQDGIEQKKKPGTTETSPDETVVTLSPDTERIRSIENLGSADAKTSMEYDHAGTELILYAELLTDGISLEWNGTQNNAFVSYVIVRSTLDENPYYPKTDAIATRNDRSMTTYADADAKAGTDYFYRICYMRSHTARAACGNILKITY